MTTLKQILVNRDSGLLRIFFETWGIETGIPVEKSNFIEKFEQFVDEEKITTMIKSLQNEERNAIDDLMSNGGKMSWANFSRKYGEMREMGEAKRERERPYEIGHATTSEYLWYRCLINIDFFITDPDVGLMEYVYIPEDIIHQIEKPSFQNKISSFHPIIVDKSGLQLFANDNILENICTYLAGIRNFFSDKEIEKMFIIDEKVISNHLNIPTIRLSEIKLLLSGIGFDITDEEFNTHFVGEFLEESRSELLLRLVDGWIRSQDYNELKLLPNYEFEGEWNNYPEKTRKYLLSRIEYINFNITSEGSEGYISLDDFVNWIKNENPEFLRPTADYDSWFIKEKLSGNYLRGFESWDAVEGQLIRYMITVHMYWLGLVDLLFAKDKNDHNSSLDVEGFRLSSWGKSMLKQKAPHIPKENEQKIVINSNGSIHIPVRSFMRNRYQFSRFCEWIAYKKDIYSYRISPSSLENARKQGLMVKHLIWLINENVEIVPPSLLRALREWENNGSQARLERSIILRVRNPDILRQLQKTNASRFLGDPLSTTAIIVKNGAQEKVIEALAEIGYLSEANIDG